ncbi:hypothetical protein WDW37_07915 [Bdellovibrionota bacterium FG-1]
MNSRKSVILEWVLGAVLSASLWSGCATGGPPVRAQEYAKLSNHRAFEYEFPVVWKGIENALRNYKILERDPKEVDALELKKLTHRSLETEWFYAQSRDKYHEYTVNSSPRKVYLQTRIKYRVDTKRGLGATEVAVETQEEIEKLKEDGTPAGFAKTDSPDSSRANEILDRVGEALLKAVP